MPESYSVFVKFRHRRLTLMRRIPTLANATEFAERIRSLRFHDPDSVFIVDDRTGEIVDGGAQRSSHDTVTPLSSPRAVPENRALSYAEEALQQTLTWTRQAHRELPGLSLGDAIEKLESAHAELAQARRLLESAQELSLEDTPQAS
jgi:hypothetical protein